MTRWNLGTDEPEATAPSPTGWRPPAAVEIAASLAPETRVTLTPASVARTHGRPRVERLLTALVENDGSDLHLAAGEPPWMRKRGELLRIAQEPVQGSDDITRLLREIASPEGWAEFESTNELDFAHEMSVDDGAALDARFRINVQRSMGRPGMVIRYIPSEIPSLADLRVPDQLRSLAFLPRGLVLVCGATGSGKTNTLAALLDVANEGRSERIWTFEDPIEFVHRPKRCLVNHREVGADTASFLEGLRRVRRQDPDIVLVGEMRDYETIDAGIAAAENGHLVFSTIHSNSAPDTVNRIINSFPGNQQQQAKTTLASVLQAVIVQTLVPAPSTPRGRVVACEIMMVSDAMRNNIEKNELTELRNAMTSTATGSQHLEYHLAELVKSGLVDRDAAAMKANRPDLLKRFLGDTR